MSVGQKLRVPDFEFVKTPIKSEKTNVVGIQKETKNIIKKDVASTQQSVNVAKEPVKKISSDPTKKLPTISARSSSKFAWPVRGKILSSYGAKSNGLFNDGINIAASRGADVKAAENGVVAYAGNEVKGMGNLVIIQHAGGWMTVYAHMDSMNVRRGHKVSVGQSVKKGEVVCVLEAMKMENDIPSSCDGVVASVNVQKGSNVNANDVIITIN